MRQFGISLIGAALAIGLLVAPTHAGTGPNEAGRFALDGKIYGYVTTNNCPQMCSAYTRLSLRNGKHYEQWLEVVKPSVGNNVQGAYYGFVLFPDAASAAFLNTRMKEANHTNPNSQKPAKAIMVNFKAARDLHQWYWWSQDNNGCYVATGGVYRNAVFFAIVTSGDQTGVTYPCGAEASWTVLVMQGLHDKAVRDPWHLQVR